MHIFDKRNRGFTLIEILVVIAIIGILVAAVIVSVVKYRDKARSTAALLVANSVMPAAIECDLKGLPLGSMDVGAAICNGSSFSWPTLNTPGTINWSWGGTNGSDQYYLANGATSPWTYVFCQVSSTYTWPEFSNIKPGTCIVVQ